MLWNGGARGWGPEIGTRGQPPSRPQSAGVLGSAHTQADLGPSSTPLLASHYQPHPSTLLPRGKGKRQRPAKGLQEMVCLRLAAHTQTNEHGEMNGTLPVPPAQERPMDTTAPTGAGGRRGVSASQPPPQQDCLLQPLPF